jgi:hypothetical protein
MNANSIFNALLVAGAVSLTLAMPAQASPISGQGTWESTLQARDLDKDG